jgi:hypothetical protein
VKLSGAEVQSPAAVPWSGRQAKSAQSYFPSLTQLVYLKNKVNIASYVSNNSSSWTEDFFGINVLLEPSSATETAENSSTKKRQKW